MSSNPFARGCRRLIVGMLCALLGACAATPPAPPDGSAAARCLQQFRAYDRRMAGGGVAHMPTRPARVPGFPYLRVDRFLASYGDEELDATAREAWLARMAQLDRQARRIQRDMLSGRGGTAPADTGPSVEQLAVCAGILAAHDLGDPRRLEALRRNAGVGSEYRLANQVLGLYPLAAAPVGIGVARYQRGVRRTFARPLASLPVRGRLRRFVPPPGPPTAAPDAFRPGESLALDTDALGVPRPTEQQLAALYRRHAPMWEIDVAADYDLPGAPRFGPTGTPGVDTRQAVVFRYPSWTRWQGGAVLQLNYVIWFDRRPPEGPLNLLGGALDGLHWRVTLDSSGEVLLYDTVHPCGCYHYLLPTLRLALRPDTQYLPEPPLVPQSAPRPAAGERIVIRAASGSHYVQRVYADHTGGGEIYQWRTYRELYTVPGGNGNTRSLFGKQGLVPGSARAERWLLWPTGVPSPGAMRERGRQAVTFVGRRHFDDAHLLDKLFTDR